MSTKPEISSDLQNAIFDATSIINDAIRNEDINKKLSAAVHNALSFIYNNTKQLNNFFEEINKDIPSKLLLKLKRFPKEEFKKNTYENSITQLIPCIFEYFTHILIINDDFLWKGDKQIHEFIDYVKSNINSFPEEIKNAIQNTLIISPIAITRQLINHPAITIIRKFSDDFEEHKRISKEWEVEFKKNQNDLKNLQSQIENLKFEYNFVGLVNGFRNIRKNKKDESFAAFLSMLFLSIGMILLPLIIFLNSSFSHKIQNQSYSEIISLAIPSLTIEILALYYFRIFLQQYKSIQAQLLQIDLRISLCQFIESYINYKKINKIDKDESLSKFESLIFSGIVADAGSIPSTFEGMEQVSNLFKSIGSAKN